MNLSLAKVKEIIGVSFFLVPDKHLIRTSSLPPYGVARQNFFTLDSNLAPIHSALKNVHP
ncbi:hypothetical protein DRE96_23415 [Salmonella enterica subsp. enterica serovar Chester]|nr:hypothetical protein [Salmonella enterica subsp. enterica serovar Chester]